jgi:hypothetical protein
MCFVHACASTSPPARLRLEPRLVLADLGLPSTVPDHAARGVEIDDMTDETDPDCRQLRPGSRLGQKSMHRCHNCGQTSYMMVSLLLMMLIRCLLLPMLIMMWRLQII